MKRLAIASVSLFSALSLFACGGDSRSLGSATGGSSSRSGNSLGGGTATSGGSSGSGCTGSFEEIQSSTGLCVAKVVTITGPSSDAGDIDYNIDATEVTKGQYDAWLATSPSLPASMDANCSYVTSYAEQDTLGVYTGTDADHHPVVFVDWCDAYAYCAAVSKRLCGALGGGSNAYLSYQDATSSQWYRACSSAGTYSYSYGDTYQGKYCNDGTYGAGTTLAAGTLTTCQSSISGYEGVYDLSGNVAEWEDSCDQTGQSAHCYWRGGSFYDIYPLCDGVSSDSSRSNVEPIVGFRCCSR